MLLTEVVHDGLARRQQVRHVRGAGKGCVGAKPKEPLQPRGREVARLRTLDVDSNKTMTASSFANWRYPSQVPFKENTEAVMLRNEFCNMRTGQLIRPNLALKSNLAGDGSA